jgi:hypothetical protein
LVQAAAKRGGYGSSRGLMPSPQLRGVVGVGRDDLSGNGCSRTLPRSRRFTGRGRTRVRAALAQVRPLPPRDHRTPADMNPLCELLSLLSDRSLSLRARAEARAKRPSPSSESTTRLGRWPRRSRPPTLIGAAPESCRWRTSVRRSTSTSPTPVSRSSVGSPARLPIGVEHFASRSRSSWKSADASEGDPLSTTKRTRTDSVQRQESR